MADQQSIDKYVWNISNIWRKYGLDMTNYIGSILYVMCLNKMIDECGEVDHQNTAKLVELTKVLYRANSVSDVELLRNSSAVLEEACGLRRGILDTVLTPYRYMEEGWKKAFLEVIGATADIIIDEEGYYPYAKALIYECGKAFRIGPVTVSSEAVSELLRIAADVQDGNRVLDGTVGYGYSAIKCVEGKRDVYLRGVDINAEAVAVAAMLAILAGKSNYEFVQEDFTSMINAPDIDRVVMDIPLAMKMGELALGQKNRTQRWMDTDVCREAEALFIATGLEALCETGRLVVIVPLSFLFKQTKSISTFRRNLIKEGLLKAVVNLPPVYNSTSVRTAMLVFERGNDDVLFVEAGGLIQRERRNDAFITEENKTFLSGVLIDKREVEGVSFRVPNSEMLEINDWSISVHMRADVDVKSRTIKEINEELRQYYELLENLNSKSNSIKLFQ